METRPLVAGLVLAALSASAIAQETTDKAAHKATPNATQARPATILLITSKQLAPAFEPFARWKTQQGKATKVVTVHDIGRQYEGEDIQQKIRACVLSHIDKHGTRWVILGGDSEGAAGHVPDRDTLHRQFRYKDIPTDLYYISDKSWDGNGDGVYGEWRNDRDAVAYTNKKASIGRIPVRTKGDVQAYTDKVIGYESRYPTQGFASKFVQTCPEPGAYPKLRTSQAKIDKAWKQGSPEQFFHDQSPWDKKLSGDFKLTPKNWVEKINEKSCSKVHMHGHGLLPLWVLSNRKTFTRKHVGQLKNTDAYLCMTTVSCFVGQYDSPKDPSITESMLRHKNGGAVLIVAPSRQGVPVFHNPRRDMRLMMTKGKMDGTTELLTRFWVHALGGKNAGDAMSAAREDLREDAYKTAGYHWCLSELNLLGDPTLDLRAQNPIVPELDVKAKVATGDQKLVIKTQAGATVCAWKGEEVYAVGHANDAGQAELAIHPTTAGTMSVTVSGPGLNVVSKKVEVYSRR